MYCIVLILCAVIFILTLKIFQYRRQMKLICRQSAFIRKNDSISIISTEMQSGITGKLRNEINMLIKEKKKLQKLYLEKERNIAYTYTNIAHDIRTPLTSLDGYFQLLYDSQSNEERERYINIIKERITSLTEMLDDLFTFTKLKNDAYELELSSVNLTAILKETILSYYEDWLAKGINPNINITEKSCIINGNDLAVRRVIQNIIKNVLVHGNDEISISLESEMNVNLIISNKIDNPEKIEIDKIFDRFYKADESRTVSSSGLGLSIAYELVRHMKGSIEADINGNIFSIKIIFHSISKDVTKNNFPHKK